MQNQAASCYVTIRQCMNFFCQSKIKNKISHSTSLAGTKVVINLSSMKKRRFCSHWVPNKAPEGDINAGTESLARQVDTQNRNEVEMHSEELLREGPNSKNRQLGDLGKTRMLSFSHLTSSSSLSLDSLPLLISSRLTTSSQMKPYRLEKEQAEKIRYHEFFSSIPHLCYTLSPLSNLSTCIEFLFIYSLITPQVKRKQ